MKFEPGIFQAQSGRSATDLYSVLSCVVLNTQMWTISVLLMVVTKQVCWRALKTWIFVVTVQCRSLGNFHHFSLHILTFVTMQFRSMGNFHHFSFHILTYVTVQCKSLGNFFHFSLHILTYVSHSCTVVVRFVCVFLPNHLHYTFHRTIISVLLLEFLFDPDWFFKESEVPCKRNGVFFFLRVIESL